MDAIFEKRRSTKAFLDQKVKDEDVEKIIEAGLSAPSGMNRQGGVIIDISDEETIEKLKALNSEIGKFPSQVDPFHNAKRVLLVIVKKSSTAIYDGSCMMENMLLEASSIGLGACWIHRAKEEIESEKGKEILSSLPLDLDDYIGVGHVVLGYPKVESIKHEVNPGRVYHL